MSQSFRRSFFELQKIKAALPKEKNLHRRISLLSKKKVLEERLGTFLPKIIS